MNSRFPLILTYLGFHKRAISTRYALTGPQRYDDIPTKQCEGL